MIHSIDAYILRCIHRRCNYNAHVIERALDAIQGELMLPRLGNKPTIQAENEVAYYMEQYYRSGMADVVIAPYLNGKTVKMLSVKHLEKLRDAMNSMIIHKPFEVVTIHDAFKCHANNMNHLRQHYINIFAELTDSNVLSDTLSQIHGKPGVFPKLSSNLSSLIRGSNYALS